MPRRYRPPQRVVLPDARYNSELISQFINKIMQRGKKSVAQQIVYGAMELLEERSRRNAMEVFEQAMRNVTPTIEVKPRRVGGATYQVPVEVEPRRRSSLAFRWLHAAAQSRPGKTMSEKLAAELLDAANNEGAAVRRRDETHRMAESNRAFAHYRW